MKKTTEMPPQLQEAWIDKLQKRKKSVSISKIKRVKPHEITIERILWDDKGKLTALDVHDESTGYAYFLEVRESHFHGFYSLPPKKK